MSSTTASQIQTVAATRRERLVVEDSSAISHLMDTGKFEHLQRISQVMGAMSVLPDHLVYVKGNAKNELLPQAAIAANCFRIANQALRWGIDPFAMVDETYVVGGKLGYSGKLVAAVVNSRAGLSGRLDYKFSGAGDDRTVTVLGTFKGESEPRTIDLRLRDAKTDNQMWRKDPDQKLIYSGVVKWARRFCPEVVLGVLTDSDLEQVEDGRGSNFRQTGETRSIKVEDYLPPAPALAAPAPATVVKDPFGQVVTVPPPVSEATAEQIIQQRTAEIRQAAPAPEPIPQEPPAEPGPQGTPCPIDQFPWPWAKAEVIKWISPNAPEGWTPEQVSGRIEFVLNGKCFPGTRKLWTAGSRDEQYAAYCQWVTKGFPWF